MDESRYFLESPYLTRIDAALMSSGDYYMHLADLQSYMAADQRMIGTYQARESWTGMAIKNIAASGPFSSDRTIAQYASETRKGLISVQRVPVDPLHEGLRAYSAWRAGK